MYPRFGSLGDSVIHRIGMYISRLNQLIVCVNQKLEKEAKEAAEREAGGGAVKKKSSCCAIS
jgi:hypothetical protein